MNQKSKHEEIMAGLELAIGEIMNPKSLNVWISVRERSITKILSEAGVSVNFSSAVLEELGKLGFVEREGSGAGMRYKVTTNIIPDYSSLTEKIYKNYQVRYSNGKDLPGYPSSRKSDLHPKRTKKHSLTEESGKARIIVREPSPLGAIGYIIANDRIQECKLIGIHYADEEMKKVLYDVEVYNENEETHYKHVKDVCMCKFFLTPEDCANFLIKRCTKYVKRCPSIK